MALPPLLAMGIGYSVKLIEFGVTSVIVGGFCGLEGSAAAMTNISDVRKLSPIMFKAETLNL